MSTPEALAGALISPGLAWLALTFILAGLVRGFTGFGTALIFMPVGAIFLPVPVAIVIVTVAGMLTWPLIVPQAFRLADRREVAVLAGAAIITAPLGVWLLSWVERDLLRWLVAAAAALTLLALVTGWRYRQRVRGAGLGAIGAVAGVLGGTTGLTGPPVILFYLAGQLEVARVRANTILFLAVLDIGIVANLVFRGLVDGTAVWLAALLAFPYAAGMVVGQRLFRPERERAFRGLAYLVIAGAILTGLPVFG
ncbi:sulfite exporter TauE/SafE family protein [Sinisalibacter lacisalsi]|uniref:Probable membrane transporter protein n=1 Tax=Sinisalibacter lacisalsi TaxID=1526570 RepID=A0ABQ1QR16_9RHOB|nr:sulfite exporter TauE/SafE family protein [Sinisalibacter lacisalsi]GGD41613.1 membrane protein [Sinisalibacter lacisalsi]